MSDCKAYETEADTDDRDDRKDQPEEGEDNACLMKEDLPDGWIVFELELIH